MTDDVTDGPTDGLTGDLYDDPWSPEPRSPLLRIVAAMAAVALIVAVVAVALRLGTGGGSLSGASVPGVTETPFPGPCVDTTGARAAWTDVTHRLDALVLHPDVSRVGTLAAGTAAQEIRQYIQQNLLSRHLTERERERLETLQVLQPGCAGAFLTVRVAETLVQDDYLAADGHVDHADPGVGQTHSLVESYQRSGGAWKVFLIVPLDQPQPSDSGQFV